MGAPPGSPSGVTAAAVAVVSTVSTFAGSATFGSVDGTGAAATFGDPRGLTVDTAGNVYVVETNRVRKITPAAVVTTLAGSGTSAFADGTGAAASFSIPLGIAADLAGNLYVADAGNQRIRKVTPAGVVTTLAGTGAVGFANGAGTVATFSGPQGIAVDGTGNCYVADSVNHLIRFVGAAGDVATLAGQAGVRTYANGQGAAAGFAYPSGIAVDGANVWIADSSNQRIRKMTPAGDVSTLAGQTATTPFADGIGAAATFFSPQGIALDAADNAFVADEQHHRIRMVTPAGVVTTLAGSGTGAFADGLADVASFNSPKGIAVDAARNVYVSDSNNNRIRKIVSVGIRQLTVSWSAPGNTGSSPITGYTATATAAGFAPKTCTTTGVTMCAITGLTSGTVYSVSVIATNAAGASGPSAPSVATPN